MVLALLSMLAGWVVAGIAILVGLRWSKENKVKQANRLLFFGGTIGLLLFLAGVVRVLRGAWGVISPD